MEQVTIEEILKYPTIQPIDIRSSKRYQEGHLPNAINIPMEQLIKDPSRYLNLRTTYYVYCEFGYKTRRISKVLNELGYHIVVIKDGYYAYENINK